MKTSRSHAGASPAGRPAKVARPKRDTTGEVPAEVPPRWSWHYRALSRLRARLIEERSERLREAAEPIERHSLHQADSATDEFNHELALSQLSAEQDALYEVEAAMKRITDGGYGVCEQTGKRIPAARLRAVPWTRFREEVEARLEITGMTPRPRLGKRLPAGKIQPVAGRKRTDGGAAGALRASNGTHHRTDRRILTQPLNSKTKEAEL